MARVKLTAGRVRDFSCTQGRAQEFLWDADVPGLAVRVTPPGEKNPSGAKSYIFQGRVNGSSVRLTIGALAAWDIDEARNEARRLQRMIDLGIDPRSERAEREAAAAAKIAMQDEAAKALALAAKPALELWFDYVEAKRVKWSASHLRDHGVVAQAGGERRTRGRRPSEPELTQPGILVCLLSRPLGEIDVDAVRSWLERESKKRPTHARLAFGLLRAFLHWCGDQKEYRGAVREGACSARLAKEVLPKKGAKDDCLQREQLAAWFAEVTKLPPVQAAYLQCVLLIGPRRNELADLEWSKVDFKWRSLTIGDKVDGERTVPLTPYVAELLKGLKRLNETPPPQHRILNGKRVENDLANWKPSRFVFASAKSASGHLVEPRLAHDAAVRAAGLPHLTIHGLRRSFGTLAEWVECPAGVIAQIQGHKPSATAEKHYRVRPLDLLRVWHERIEAWLLQEAGLEQPERLTHSVKLLAAR